jgi:hypothetical protein
VFERQHVKTLNPYSRMALAVRGWGLEVALALGVFGLWETGAALGGEGLAVLFLGLLAIGLWRFPWLRDRLATTLRERATRRWFNRVLLACEVISRRGQIPRVEGTESIPAGQRLRLLMPPGFNADLVEEAGESLAATVGAREVRVVRDAANASIVRLSIIWRDPLALPVPAWSVPSGSLWEPIALGIDEDGNPCRRSSNSPPDV